MSTTPSNRYGRSVRQRIEQYRNINGECWESSMGLSHTYPQINVGGKKFMIHRVAYEEYVGEIPRGMHVLHRCDNPRCHNPKHLFLGTVSDNMRDMHAKKRHSVTQRSFVDPHIAATLSASLSQAEVAECFGVSQSRVSKALRSIGASRGRATSFGKGHGLGGRRPK